MILGHLSHDLVMLKQCFFIVKSSSTLLELFFSKTLPFKNIACFEQLVPFWSKVFLVPYSLVNLV